MSLLLTKTCEYAILVNLQQGRHFANVQTIKIQSTLDLKLPASINDLIPPDTTIYSQAVKVTSDGLCQFNTSLAYLVSSKLLQRLRKSEANVVLTVQQVSANGKIINNNSITLRFSIAEAKEVVPQSPHKMDHIYKFIADKGAWCRIGADDTELKAGIFFVAMPDNTKTIVHTPFIELKSPPPLPPYVKRTSYLTNNKKKISSIIGQSINKRNISNNSSNSSINSNNSINSINSINNNNNNNYIKKQSQEESSIVTASSKTEEKPRLRRAKSSLADLNIDELAKVLKNIKIRTSQEMPTPPPPKNFLSYRQIGNGTSAYTFYFRIINADHIDPLLLRPTIRSKPTLLKKPYFSYAFHTTHNLIPASSFSIASTTRACFRLKGHLVDIQSWLDKIGAIEIRLVVMDKMTKQTVGMTKVPLQGLAFESSSLQTLSYPIYDEKTMELATLKDAIAKITVRIGIMSGWHQDEEEDKVITRAKEEEQDYKKRDNTTSMLSSTDPWELFHHTNDLANKKKMRHHSQSSVPTLLTTSTTTTSSKSSSCYLVTPNRSNNKKKHLFL